MTEKHWQFYTAATAVIAVLVSVYCLSEDITGIFVHLYYIPILIASYQYRERGLLLSLFLVMVYLLLVFFYFPGDAHILLEGCIRGFALMAIAAIISVLSGRIQTHVDALQREIEGHKKTEEALRAEPIALHGAEHHRRPHGALRPAPFLRSAPGRDRAHRALSGGPLAAASTTSTTSSTSTTPTGTWRATACWSASGRPSSDASEEPIGPSGTAARSSPSSCRKPRGDQAEVVAETRTEFAAERFRPSPAARKSRR